MFYSKKCYFLLLLVCSSFSLLFGNPPCYWGGSGHIYCFWNYLDKAVHAVINNGVTAPRVTPNGSVATSTITNTPLANTYSVNLIQVYDDNNNLLCSYGDGVNTFIPSTYGSYAFDIVKPNYKGSPACVIIPRGTKSEGGLACQECYAFSDENTTDSTTLIPAGLSGTDHEKNDGAFQNCINPNCTCSLPGAPQGCVIAKSAEHLSLNNFGSVVLDAARAAAGGVY